MKAACEVLAGVWSQDFREALLWGRLRLDSVCEEWLLG